ncbi:MAG: PKD domain-containing protein [Bacteroidetes bacterium]|jgi:hypothetical protein|nr:PKD domain-containing protein [Bacteroidota bacterium]
MRLLFFFVISILAIPGSAQKYDNVWLFGRNSSTPEFAGTIMDFDQSPPELFLQFWDSYFYQTNASICDTAGNLQFYTNGIYVANALHEPMENGDGLNPGAHAEEQGEDGRGYILGQGAIILPVPESDSLYYLLHMDKIAFGEEGVRGSSKHLYYTVINMDANNGLGTVVEKNQILKEGALSRGKVTATRHANGRDWWVIIRQLSTNRYYKFLVSPSGIVEYPSQAIGESIPSPGVGQATFSPDGSKYANLNLVNGIGTDDYIGIYDFDRCTGMLSNPNVFAYRDSAWSGGVAISPSSRYLYVSSYLRVFQYDLWATDVEASRDTVAEWDGFVEDGFFATTFYLAQLAPDGKIYINSNNSVSYLHVIEQPDLPGDSCQVCQHCVDLPTKNAFSLPNFPNYRLGPLEGSPCDTLRAPPTAAFTYRQSGPLRYRFQDSSYHDIRSWQWDFGDGHTDSIPRPEHVYEVEGAYNVCLTVSNPRGSDTLCQVVEAQVTSTEDAGRAMLAEVYPNPSGGPLWLRTAGLPGSEPVVLELYSVAGQLLRRSTAAPNGEEEIEVEELPAGVYYYRVLRAGSVLGNGKWVVW